MLDTEGYNADIRRSHGTHYLTAPMSRIQAITKGSHTGTELARTFMR